MLTTTYSSDISVQERKLKSQYWKPSALSLRVLCHLGPACCSVGPTPDQDSAFPTVTLILGVSFLRCLFSYVFSEEVPGKSCDTKTKVEIIWDIILLFQECGKTIVIKKYHPWDFPGSPVVMTLLPLQEHEGSILGNREDPTCHAVWPKK